MSLFLPLLGQRSRIPRTRLDAGASAERRVRSHRARLLRDSRVMGALGGALWVGVSPPCTSGFSLLLELDMGAENVTPTRLSLDLNPETLAACQERVWDAL